MNGGIGSVSKVEVAYEGQLYDLESLPKRTGYTFLGFYDNKDYTQGKQYYNENGESVRNFDKASNTTLYAGWIKDKVEEETKPQEVVEIKSYKIKFDLNGGSGGQSEEITVIYGEAIPNLNTAKPIRKDYDFMGWYDNKNFKIGIQYYTSDGTSARKYDIKDSLKLYAGWLASDTFLVKYNCNGGEGTIETDTFKKESIYIPKVNTCTKTGYVFEKWSPYKTATNKVNFTYANLDSYAENGKYGIKNNTITLYARWKEPISASSDTKIQAIANIKNKLISETEVSDCVDVIGIEGNNYNNKAGIYCKYESDSLVYYVERPYIANRSNNVPHNQGIVISHIWVKNSDKQIKVAVSPLDTRYQDQRRMSYTPQEIMKNEISVESYSSKGLIGVNSSAVVQRYRFYSNAPDNWHNGPAIPYWKNKGVIIRDSMEEDYVTKLSAAYIYGFTKTGDFKYYRFSRDSKNASLRKEFDRRVAQYVEQDGVKDTIGWSQVLVSNGAKNNITNKSGKEEGFCQINKNYYVIISTQVPDIYKLREKNPTDLSFIQDKMMEFGCTTGVLFDGGDSIAQFTKGKSASSLRGPGVGHDDSNNSRRIGGDVLYFVEQ